ncbi:hypothetical protein [Mycolicibacterium llatzerense]|uniref:hypothetical protein n=1 Tax=Mycolicibacterium llatzerense TaxID=280871 RepID=UPI0021B6446E|nr:hypothetical protein [Mycolicibacterium llatzerense]MCT7373014.1 hypothetical protein [Mycolicibacterium llatzerense]
MPDTTVTGELAHLPSSDVALRALHSQIEELAVHASQARITRTPVRVGNNGAGCEMTYWYDGEHIKVFTCEGGLFISGIEHFGHWPDWYNLPPAEARAIANALWSATVFIAQTDGDDDV